MSSVHSVMFRKILSTKLFYYPSLQYWHFQNPINLGLDLDFYDYILGNFYGIFILIFKNLQYLSLEKNSTYLKRAKQNLYILKQSAQGNRRSNSRDHIASLKIRFLQKVHQIHPTPAYLKSTHASTNFLTNYFSKLYYFLLISWFLTFLVNN